MYPTRLAQAKPSTLRLTLRRCLSLVLLTGLTSPTIVLLLTEISLAQAAPTTRTLPELNPGGPQPLPGQAPRLPLPPQSPLSGQSPLTVPGQAPRSPAPRAAAPLPNSFYSDPFDDEDYILGPGDRLKIDFFNVPEFSGEYGVLPNGTINLPQMGSVSARGKSIKQVTSLITSRARKILRFPSVTVGLTAARPLSIAIAGEVTKPGSYTLSPQAVSANGGDPGGVPTLTRTIQLAEGFTQSADLGRVQIRRQLAAGSGAPQVVAVNLWDLIQKADLSQDIRLRDGDSIYIPASESPTLDNAWQMAGANFAARSNRPLKVTIVGQVNRPGPHTLTPVSNEGTVIQAPTVTRAIQQAEGITQLADIRNITVYRLTRAGASQTIKVDFMKLLQGGDVKQDLPLQEGDTVEIPTATAVNDQEVTTLASASFSPGRIVVNVIGEVVRPGPVELKPNTPLNQGLLAAGGFNNRAKSKEVTLVRLNQNGTVSKQKIALNLTEGVDVARNPALRNSDTIIVDRSGTSLFLEGAASFAGPFSGLLSIINLFRGGR
jgi:polysaccharide biosynthesis/export protein